MRRTESSQQGPEVDDEGVWNLHCNTQHPVGAGVGGGCSAMRLTEGQHRFRGPAGDETRRGNSHAKDLSLKGMGDRGIESTPGGVRHHLDGSAGVGG